MSTARTYEAAYRAGHSAAVDAGLLGGGDAAVSIGRTAAQAAYRGERHPDGYMTDEGTYNLTHAASLGRALAERHLAKVAAASAAKAAHVASAQAEYRRSQEQSAQRVAAGMVHLRAAGLIDESKIIG